MPTKAVLVYLGLGGNLGDVHTQFELARQVLSSHPLITSLRSSSNYLSKPWGGGVIDITVQNDYLNQVVEIRTTLSADSLLHFCQQLELEAGRDHLADRWSARPLDIDILLYGQQQLSSAELEVPHPRMLQRAFVLLPLSELNPDLQIPGAARLSDALKALPVSEHRNIKISPLRK
ncbi:MAG: 2-amino-4-hydroxy-6-hydroxymethyldihydropteridine diphosphokinase [Proteobacteria bacterium]|nr:2-amino-4-hydroxy-6-hydroxymethyldihydropteridine diphosphokinase [Pseudomonadota bacterium]